MKTDFARGETVIERLDVVDRTTGEPADLTGCLIISTIAAMPGADAVATIGTDSGGIVISDPPTDGVAILTWPPGMTEGLTAQVWYRDVWVVDPSANEWVVIEPEPIRVYEPVRRRLTPLEARQAAFRKAYG